jgi:hypothetical protein
MESSSVLVYNVMKHTTVKLCIAVLKILAGVSNFAIAVFTMEVETRCRLLVTS